MIKEYYEKICNGQEVRANLIALRDLIKQEKNKRAFAYLLGGDFQFLCSLLEDEDPKVRRCAAQILGKMESEDLLPALFKAYEQEKTKFIRADYLRAISDMDYQELLPQLEQQLAVLRSEKAASEDRKHISEEIRALQTMILKYRKVRRHKFCDSGMGEDIILVTNRCQREVTARQIQNGKVTFLAGGIRIRGARLEELTGIRTWSEVLFPLEMPAAAAAEPEEVGRALADRICRMVFRLHEGRPPFLFRIELKSRLEPEKRGKYVHKISDAIEEASQGCLINSVDNYELEVRLLERKDGSFVPMLKLFSFSDRRFAYRREMVSASITPVNAALAVCLARPYLKEGAQVLDPFCGVGTMLIERDYAVKAGVMYGIDILGDAIEKARRNTAVAGKHIYYINRNFFDFEHDHLFDEVITDMPQVTVVKQKTEVRNLYLDFFERIGAYLREDAILVLYVTEPQFLEEAVRRRKQYQILEEFLINEKNGTSVFVIRKNA